MSIQRDFKEGIIVIPRPLHELKNCITHFHIPDLYMIARAVKVCVFAIFRWHFYDTDSVLLANATTYIHQLNGKIEAINFPASRPYLFESGAVFSPLDNPFYSKIQFKEVAKLNSMSLTNVVSYLGTLGDSEFKKGTFPWNHKGYTTLTW